MEPRENEHPKGERLQKVLARAGMGSRRSCERLIVEGRVIVDGERATIGEKVDPDHARVEVDGVPIGVAEGLVYYLLNKPGDVVSTAADPQGRQTVVDLVPDEPRVYPVGRLDRDTEGLIILTNDGDLANRLTHPRFEVPKEYLVHVSGRPSREALRVLREGVDLEDGITAPARVSVVTGADRGRSAGVALRLVIHEGRNRQVRRMCEAVGHPVLRLVRTRIGPLVDHSLRPGDVRPLTTSEVRSLERASARPAVGEGGAFGEGGRGRQ